MMKMSDVFNLPVRVDGATVYDLRPSIWLGNPSVENNYFFGVQNTKAGEIERESTAVVIAECINAHDKLTADNAALIEALEGCVCDLMNRDGEMPSTATGWAAEAIKALRQAKGGV